MIDRLRQIAIFAKAIDHGSFRAAARVLRLSPSVVSHHVSQLEDHLGVALIYRSTRKLTLTREGDRLLAASHKMLAAVEQELLDLSGAANIPRGELRLTLPSVLSQSPLTERVAAFARACPRVKLSLDFSDMRREMIEDGVDIAVRMGPKARNSATTRKLFQVKRKLMAATRYLADKPAVDEPHALLSWDWLALTPALRVPLTFHAPDGGQVTLKPEAQFFINDAHALYQLVRAGAGLGTLPDFLAREDVAAGRVQYVLPEWQLRPIDVYAEWPANAPKHGLIRLALDALSQDRPPADQSISDVA